jgi:arylsulfatase A-like enzyme
MAHSRSESDVALTTADLFVVVCTLALGMSFGELILLGIAKFHLGRFMHLNPQIVWLAPIVYTALAVVVAAVVVLVGRGRSRRSTARAVIFCVSWLGISGGLLVHQPLHELAAIVLAAGLARIVSGVAVNRLGLVTSLARRALVPMVLLVAVMFAGLNGGWLLHERRALAALPPPPAAAPNVLLIVWDTVRAASLSLYGYERMTTPTLQMVARDGVTFDRAFSTAPWTTPSHAAMFTGHFAPDQSSDWAAALDGRATTIAEILSARGYRTAGFTANVYATSRESGLNRGFSRYVDYPVFSPAELFTSTFLMRTAIEREHWWKYLGLQDVPGRSDAVRIENEFLSWLDRDTRPFFAFLNVFDAHAPYRPPAPYDTAFGPLLPGRDPILVELRRFSPRELQAEIDAYDGSIAYLDHRLSLLLRELETRGLLDNTLVILTADHGEEFGEHGVFTHGHSLNDRVLHVPMLIRLPARLPRNLRIGEWVSIRDIPATILDVTETSGAMPGRSLARFWSSTGTKPPEPLVVAVNRAPGNPPEYSVARGDMRGLLMDPWKLVIDGDRQSHLFDLRRDPDERRDLAGTPEFAQKRAELEGLLERMAAPRGERASTPQAHEVHQ